MKLLSILVFICIATAAYAQVDIEAIKRDSNYIFGQGEGATTREADNEALRVISSQIWTFISQGTDSRATVAVDGNGNLTESEKHEIFNSSFTYNTIPNAKRLELSPEPDAVVFRYVHKNDIAAMQQKKSKQIADLVNAGKAAESALQIDDALRNYYWASLLAMSHTEPVYVEFDGERGECSAMLPGKIRRVLHNLKTTLADCEEVDGKFLAKMKFTYAGHDVATLQVRYFDGQSMVGPLNVRDGIGELDLIRLPDNGKLMLQYVYNFEDEASYLSNELKAVYANAKVLPSYTTARNDVEVKVDTKNKTIKAAKTGNSNTSAGSGAMAATEAIHTPARLVELHESDVASKLYPAMQAVESAIRTGNPALAKPYFTDAGYAMLDTLLRRTGKVTLVGNAEYKFIEANSQILGRKIPIKLRLPNGKTFMENLVLRFNPVSHKVQSIAFMLTKKAENDIFNSALPWGDISRFTILQFMEDYQTAYALKRIDFLEQLFSDNAIIITGSVLSKSPTKGVFDGVATDLSKKQKVRYRKFTKEQYISNLRHLFKDKYVHLTFEDNTAGMVNTHGILPPGAAFGIQIRQLYTCTDGYSDRGYLTLFLNMQGEYPLIEVRLWQPEDDVMPYDEFLEKFHINI